MTTNSTRNRRRQLLGRVALTIVVGGGASGTIVYVSGAHKTIQYLERIEDTLGDLSHYIADRHASIREGLTTLRSSDDDAVAGLDKGVARRLTQFRHLNALLEQETSAQLWIQSLRGNVDVQRVEEERRAYVTAAAASATTRFSDPEARLRFFDLHAQKLIQTVEAVRDSAAAARARALFAADGVVAVSSALGGLLIACLIWHPVFQRAPHLDACAR